MNLANLVVTFAVKGAKELESAIGGIQSALQTTQKVLSSVGAVATSAFTAATAAATGLAMAGIHASATGQLLSFHMERLARAVGGLVNPEVMKFVELISRLTDWIASLSDKQKEQLGGLIEGAAAFALLARMINPIVGLISALVVGTEGGRNALGSLFGTVQKIMAALAPIFEALSSALETIVPPILSVVNAVVGALAPVLRLIGKLIELNFKLMEPFIVIIAKLAEAILRILTPVIEKIVDVLVWFIEKIEIVIDKLREFLEFVGLLDKKVSSTAGKSREALMGRVGAPEAIDATWTRVAQASAKIGAGKDIPEQQLDELKAIRMEQQKTNQELGRMKPAFAQ